MDQTKDKHVNFYGHVAKFPKHVKAQNAYAFLEKVKVAKNKVWYVFVEPQLSADGSVAELQMLKYNRVEGVNLHDFVRELCGYYAEAYAAEPAVLEALSKLEVVGEDKFAVIRNISPVKMGGMPMVARVMGDLIKLLA
jgi:hypothetical protein